MLKILFTYLNLIVATAPNLYLSLSQYQLIFCIQQDFNYSIFSCMIFWPIAMRFHYINQVSQVIRNFYEDRNELKEREQYKKLKCLFFSTVGTIIIIILLLCIGIVSDERVEDVLCICNASYDLVAKFINIGLRVLILIFEVAFLSYSNYQIMRHQVKTKYGIKCELQTVSLIYLLGRVEVIIYLALFKCSDISAETVAISVIFIQLQCFLIFTLLVVVVLFRRRNPNYENYVVPQTLLCTFPEALYFWTPNYYFNLYLTKHKPSLLHYRPLMADILRYDFQIQDANNCSVESHQVTEGGHQSYEMKLIGQEKKCPRDDIQQNPELKKLCYFCHYIQARYFSKQSRCRCEFEDEPEVLQNILQKFKNLEENLDEFLFEFVRPYIEAKLTPIYEEFVVSQSFRKMQKDLEVGEVFEWMISYQKGM